MMSAMVSVVIPTFNRAHTLERALNSVLVQKDVSFEVFVVDDGSIDDTRSLVEAISKTDSQVHYLFQSNQGPSAARNLGIRASRREFVAFLDSDDEWLPGKLKAQLEFFEANPTYLICQTEEIWIRNGVRVNPMKKHQKFGGFIFEKCLPLSIVSPSCVMMRREFFDQVGLFDESLPACEDYDLWLRASARLPISLIPKPYVIKYGGHEDQRSRQFSVMDQFRIRALLKLFHSGELNSQQKELVASEILRKANIVVQGARKRGKIGEAKYYEGLVENVLKKNLIVHSLPLNGGG
ncbi:MAG: glycosyltransferase family 2 protein [Candidatus Omnitrophica bacterium]|nr:glycosyltransferase family 2 protein [Candidatus Omnitrophota bacterium]